MIITFYCDSKAFEVTVVFFWKNAIAKALMEQKEVNHWIRMISKVIQ